ncbi:FecCD family ABC transporter permease [Methylocystis bryophila]|uniref:ABC transporter permease n=1 Tax=Methylocystis bryophila TaxID=655015 RepID=A0A1W6MXZ5_9HYPH|nr:iron ABC transporter permease [Methylocystis bryophila]ARN82444.1 ABC transporter permease [Methylocystis bryophila]BDV38628.1 iron ABC transporter permease [Methylocystis bryophila]
MPFLGLIALLLLVGGFALTIGRYPIGISDLLAFLGAQFSGSALDPARRDLLHNVIVEIRLPRILGAGLIGAALAISGASYQAVFRNPLVSPGILGVLGGASFGAGLGILSSGNWLTIQLLAFLMGLVAVGVGVLIANLCGPASTVMLLLGGMISGALFTSLLSIVKYTADPNDQLPSIVYWLMGSLGGIDLRRIGLASGPLLFGMISLALLGRPLDALAMGDDEARSLGVPVTVVRYGVILLATLISSLAVALAGMIGWIGLFVPHVARLAFGPLNSRLLPRAALLGAIFLIIADSASRTLAAAEIPIGVVTELIGIPAFVLVLRSARRAWL